MPDNTGKLYRHYGRLGVALIRCMEQLKNSSGESISVYYRTVEEIDGLMRVCACCEESDAAIEEPLMRLHAAADRQDAKAVSEVLESQVYPIIKGWFE